MSSSDGPVVLESFCGGGGVTWGLLAAGATWVICTDIEDHSAALAKVAEAWPGRAVEFHQADWRDGLARFGHLADFTWGSPPCQFDSNMSNCRPGLAGTYPDFYVPYRDAVEALGAPWLAEQPDNPGVRGKMRRRARLCGTQFGLEGTNDEGVRFGLQRHRLFEADIPLTDPGRCRHVLPRLPVYGHGAPGNFPWKGTGMERARREGMGIGWMTRAELDEAIPWVFAAYMAGQLLACHPALARFGLGDGWQDLASASWALPLF